MESAAERQKRYRQHVKGDHSLCKESRDCNNERRELIDSDADIPTSTTRGNQLIEDLKAGLAPETLVLLEEAARIADRLDRLDAILVGKQRQWMHFRTREDGQVNVVLTGALAEARQQATALAVLMRDIRAAKNASSATPAPKSKGVLGGLADELAPRRKGSTA